MSMGNGACRAKGHRHVVAQRLSNRSAFNGYHRTPSDWSEVWCMERGRFWRTKAAYVNDLPNATPSDVRGWGHARARGVQTNAI